MEPSGTAVRSGIIGEVGVGNALSPRRAQERPGRRPRQPGHRSRHFLSPCRPRRGEIHRPGHGGGSEGADLNRVIIGHSNHIATQIPYMKRLLERGVYIQFDLMGEVIPRLGRIHDYDTVQSIVQLIRDGYADRLLLSQDVCTKTMMKTYGGHGFFVRDGVRPARAEAPGGSGGGPPSDHGGEPAPGSDLRKAGLGRSQNCRLLAGTSVRTGITA